jgi:hypothetical protein
MSRRLSDRMSTVLQMLTKLSTPDGGNIHTGEVGRGGFYSLHTGLFCQDQ